MAVAFSTVRTNLYTNVFNHLKSDATHAITSNNIHPSFNSEQLITEGYPQVVIKKPVISVQRMAVGSMTALRFVPFSMEIDVHHNSAANARTVADEISNSIFDGNLALRQDGLYELNLEEDAVEEVEYQENKTNHVYTLTLTGRFTAKVG